MRPSDLGRHRSDLEAALSRIDDESRVIVVGTSAEVVDVLHQLDRHGGAMDVVATRELMGGSISRELASLDVDLDRHRPDLVLISIPAAMDALIQRLRTHLRRRGVVERYLPPWSDLLAGTGPRTVLDVSPEMLLARSPRPLDHDRIAEVIRDRAVLITGAGGTIGAELARRVASYGPASLILMDRNEYALFEIDRQIARFHPEVARTASLLDVADANATLDLFRRVRPQVVLHAAAHKHVPMSEDHPWEAVRNNVLGSKSAVDAAGAVGATHFVQISTDKAVAPRSIMGATKRLAEVLVQSRASEHALACAVVRFGNVLGSSGSVLDVWRRELADGGPITLTDRRMTRYLMTVGEAAGLVLQAATFAAGEAADPGEIFVLDMGEPVRIIDLAERFLAAHGLGLLTGEKDRSSGVGLELTGIRPGEKLEEILAHPGETLEPTGHPAIATWRDRPPSGDAIAQAVDQLVLAGKRRDPNLGGLVMDFVRLLDGGMDRNVVERKALAS